MNRSRNSLIAAALMAFTAVAVAKNVPTNVPWESVVADLTKQGSLQGIELRFGSASAQGLNLSGSVAFQHKEGAFPDSNRQVPSDEILCRNALKQVLIRAVEQARARGANAVVGIISQVGKSRQDSPANAECRSGLSGTVAGISAQLAVLP